MEVLKIVNDKFKLSMVDLERGLCCCKATDKVKIIGLIGPRESGKSLLLNYISYNYDSNSINGFVPIKNIIKQTQAFYWGDGTTHDGVYMHIKYINNDAVIFLEANGDYHQKFVQLVSSHLIYNIKSINDYNISQIVSDKLQRITVVMRDVCDTYQLDTSNEMIQNLKKRTYDIFQEVSYEILPYPFEETTVDFTGDLKHLNMSFINSLHQFRLNCELYTKHKTYKTNCNILLQDIPNFFHIAASQLMNNEPSQVIDSNTILIDSLATELQQMKGFEKLVKSDYQLQVISSKAPNKCVNKYYNNYTTYLKNKILSYKCAGLFILALPFVIFPDSGVILFWYNSIYILLVMAIHTLFLLIATRIIINQHNQLSKI